jgi:hypothetical protein
VAPSLLTYDPWPSNPVYVQSLEETKVKLLVELQSSQPSHFHFDSSCIPRADFAFFLSDYAASRFRGKKDRHLSAIPPPPPAASLDLLLVWHYALRNARAIS